MQSSVVTVLLLAAVLSQTTEAMTDGAIDCCLSTKATRIPLQIVADFFHQTTETGCPIPATVFITKKNKKLCAPAENTWVSKIISHLEEKKKKKSSK